MGTSVYKNIVGAYVPMTTEGNIMVDGVLASCYASADHDLAHLSMAPLRWFPEMTNWMFGQDGVFPSYVKIVKDFIKVLPASQLVSN